jgi:hypothetical protein
VTTINNSIQAWLTSQSKVGTNLVDYILVDRSDGNGPIIGYWNADILGSQPAADQLASVATQAQALGDAAALVTSRAAVDALREAHLASGFTDSTTGKTLQADTASTVNWTAMASSAFIAMSLAVSPAPQFVLICSDNSQLVLGPSDTLSLLNGRMMPWVSAVFLHARSLKDQLIAGGTPDITQGWP